VIDMQLLNDALMTVAFAVGLAIGLSALIVAVAALTQRRASRAGVRQIERLLAAVAEQRNSPATK
jgi:cytochrome c biogenesis protein CcdA